MATPFGRALAAIGAVPIAAARAGRPRTCWPACSIVVPAVALSGVVLLAGARHLPREMALMLAKLKAAGPTGRPRRAGDRRSAIGTCPIPRDDPTPTDASTLDEEPRR